MGQVKGTTVNTVVMTLRGDIQLLDPVWQLRGKARKRRIAMLYI